MYEHEQLEQLVSYDQDHPVISLYIPTDLAHQNKDGVRLIVRHHLGKLQADKSDIERIQKYLDYEYDWQARGLAIFSAGDFLWKSIPLPVSVDPEAYLSDKPYVGILANLIDFYAPFGIALLDKEQLRLFMVSWGEIQARTELTGEELKRHKQGGWSAQNYQRHEDHLAVQNLKQAIEAIQTFMEFSGIEYLLLAGSSSVIAQVKELMPTPLKDTIVGEFSADIGIPAAKVLELALELAQEIAHQRDLSLVTRAITAASKGGEGAMGLQDTLYALKQGQVQIMLVEAGFTHPGYRCKDCGYVSADIMVKCPFCSSTDIEPTPDAVNQAIYQAIQTDATVNVVRNSQELANAGHIGALLRY